MNKFHKLAITLWKHFHFQIYSLCIFHTHTKKEILHSRALFPDLFPDIRTFLSERKHPILHERVIRDMYYFHVECMDDLKTCHFSDKYMLLSFISSFLSFPDLFLTNNVFGILMELKSLVWKLKLLWFWKHYLLLRTLHQYNSLIKDS